jgi:hypothetical protein
MNAMREVRCEALAAALHELSVHRSVYRPDGRRVVIAPFYAEARSPDFWNSLVLELQRLGTDIELWPIFLNEAKYERMNPGFAMPYANWVHPDLLSLIGTLSIGRGLDSRLPLIMDGISPQHSAPKSSTFREAVNTMLFRTGWQQAIQRDLPNVQLVTWNDYGEGTQVSPSLGTQFVFYDLSLYYSLWFKSKKPPVITQDAIYYSHRNQIIQLDSRSASDQIPMRLIGATPLHNEIEMLAFLPAPATLQIEVSGQMSERSATLGLTSFRVPAQVGQPIFRILRDKKVVVEKVSDWSIVPALSTENPEYMGGSSSRTFVPGI